MRRKIKIHIKHIWWRKIKNLENSQRFREKTGASDFHFWKKNLGKNVIDCYTAGVLEFVVNYIKKCRICYSLLFHATVFFYYFNKNFGSF